MKKNKRNKQIKHQLYVARKNFKKRRKLSIKRYLSKTINLSQLNEFEQKTYLVQLLEYSDLFGNENKPTINEILSKIPRENVIDIAITLNNLYNNASIDDLDKFFNQDSCRNRVYIERLLDDYIKRQPSSLKIFFTTSETSILLLKYLFDVPYREHINFNVSNEEAEMYIFKLILLINEKCTNFKLDDKSGGIEKLIFLLSVMNNNMHGEDENFRKDRSIMQLYLSVEFFKFIANDEEYQSIYDVFLKEFQIKSWIEYVRSIFGFVVWLNYKAGKVPIELIKNDEGLINHNILSMLSLNITDNINLNSQMPYNRGGNTDYKIFRERPLIKTDKEYIMTNWEFMIDRLYNSLFFEFKELHLNKKDKDYIVNFFTEIYAEKLILNKLICESIDKKKYFLFSEKELSKKYKKKSNELGPPDIFIENKKTFSYIIFECKDIKIGGDITETHDYNMIIEVYRNKLYKKSWKIKEGERVYLKEEKSIGITQLTGHISNIRNKKFKYLNTKETRTIYPVLILSDYKYVHRGFSKIANKWYKESLNELKVKDSHSNKPLIVMSFITMIKYKSLFQQNGFEYYFEKYYKILKKKQNSINDVFYSNISFDEFMGLNPYDLTDLHENLMEEIKK